MYITDASDPTMGGGVDLLRPIIYSPGAFRRRAPAREKGLRFPPGVLIACAMYAARTSLLRPYANYREWPVDQTVGAL